MVTVSNQGQRTFKTFSGWQGGLKIPRPAYKFPPGNFTYFLRAVLCAQHGDLWRGGVGKQGEGKMGSKHWGTSTWEIFPDMKQILVLNSKN